MKRTAQQLFDHVVRALIAQGIPSIIGGSSCRYLGPLAVKCAAGHCVPDGMSATEGVDWFGQRIELRQAVGNERLVDSLQFAHDAYADAGLEWRRQFADIFRDVAIVHKLNHDVLSEVPSTWSDGGS